MTKMISVIAARQQASPIDDSVIIARGLAVGLALSIAGAATTAGGLDGAERSSRMAALAALWAAGSDACMDEGLFADAVQRNPLLAQRLRRTYRKRPILRDATLADNVLPLALSLA